MRKKLPDIEKMPKIGISISRENYNMLLELMYMTVKILN